MDLDIAVNEIVSAIVDNKKIGIIGDYDVDGTTSASLLTKFFSHYNVETSTYIPNRLKDGYGPNIEAFKNFKDSLYNSILFSLINILFNSSSVKSILHPFCSHNSFTFKDKSTTLKIWST